MNKRESAKQRLERAIVEINSAIAECEVTGYDIYTAIKKVDYTDPAAAGKRSVHHSIDFVIVSFVQDLKYLYGT